jgi:hypothetical protein
LLGGKARGKSGLDKLLEGGKADSFEHLLFGYFIGTEVAGEKGEVAVAMRQGRGRVPGGKGGGLFGRSRSGSGHRFKVVESVGFASRGVKLVKRGWE